MLFIFSNDKNKIIRTVPIDALIFINFSTLTPFLNSFSMILYMINPIIPPRVLLIISVMSEALYSKYIEIFHILS